MKNLGSSTRPAWVTEKEFKSIYSHYKSFYKKYHNSTQDLKNECPMNFHRSSMFQSQMEARLYHSDICMCGNFPEFYNFNPNGSLCPCFSMGCEGAMKKLSIFVKRLERLKG